MSNRPNKITQLEKQSAEIILDHENLDLCVLSGLEASLASITSYQKHIPWNNKRK